MKVVGTILVVPYPKHTQYVFGPMLEIQNQVLDVIERNRSGDCLCLTDNGLVDVHHDDIVTFTPKPDPNKYFRDLFEMILKGGKHGSDR